MSIFFTFDATLQIQFPLTDPLRGPQTWARSQPHGRLYFCTLNITRCSSSTLHPHFFYVGNIFIWVAARSEGTKGCRVSEKGFGVWAHRSALQRGVCSLEGSRDTQRREGGRTAIAERKKEEERVIKHWKKEVGE